jgi:hypothetical protein
MAACPVWFQVVPSDASPRPTTVVTSSKRDPGVSAKACSCAEIFCRAANAAVMLERLFASRPRMPSLSAALHVPACPFRCIHARGACRASSTCVASTRVSSTCGSYRSLSLCRPSSDRVSRVSNGGVTSSRVGSARLDCLHFQP